MWVSEFKRCEVWPVVSVVAEGAGCAADAGGGKPKSQNSQIPET